MKPTEKQYRKALKRAMESFINHINKFRKIGSKAFPVTSEHDIVLWSKRPKGSGEFYLTIEDSNRKIIWKSAFYEAPTMQDNIIEDCISNAIRDTYLLTVDKFTKPATI